MEILELYEKSSRMKNRKFMIELTKEELEVLSYYIKGKKELLKKDIKEEEKEIEIVYCKTSFDTLSSFNDLDYIVNECILRDNNLEISYELLDVLWDFINSETQRLKKLFGRYSQFLMVDDYKRYTVLCGIIKNNEEEIVKAVYKLYPKRKATAAMMDDYIHESAYNGCLIPNNEEINIHVSMKEKETIIQQADEMVYQIENSRIKSVQMEVSGMAIVIPSEDIKCLCDSLIHLLSKNIYSGSVFTLTIRGYFILKSFLK